MKYQKKVPIIFVFLFLSFLAQGVEIGAVLGEVTIDREPYILNTKELKKTIKQAKEEGSAEAFYRLGMLLNNTKVMGFRPNPFSSVGSSITVDYVTRGSYETTVAEHAITMLSPNIANRAIWSKEVAGLSASLLFTASIKKHAEAMLELGSGLIRLGALNTQVESIEHGVYWLVQSAYHGNHRAWNHVLSIFDNTHAEQISQEEWSYIFKQREVTSLDPQQLEPLHLASEEYIKSNLRYVMDQFRIGDHLIGNPKGNKNFRVRDLILRRRAIIRVLDQAFNQYNEMYSEHLHPLTLKFEHPYSKNIHHISVIDTIHKRLRPHSTKLGYLQIVLLPKTDESTSKKAKAIAVSATSKTCRQAFEPLSL